MLLRNHPDPTAVATAISYVSFYLLGWSPIFWTLGFSQLAGETRTPPSPGAPQPRGLRDRVVGFVKSPPAPLKRIFSPPILGSVGGLLLGISPLARFFLGKVAVLAPVTNAVATLGGAYTSSAILILSGSLALPTGNKVRVAQSPMLSGVSASE